MNENEFYLKVAHALSGCQLVEQELKLYLTEALQLVHKCVRKCIGERMPFKMSGEDYANSSLERLIEGFKKLTDNEQLVKELRAFKEQRNFLSHQGITHCLDWNGDFFDSTATEFQECLEKIQVEAIRLRNAVHEEANKFSAHLDFFEEIQGT